MTDAERTELTETLKRLEIPDCKCQRELPCDCELALIGCRCDCPVRPAPPCRHVLARDHSLEPDQWAAAMLASDPEAYAERPAPPTPARVLSREARVAVKIARESAGVSLWHDEDLREEDCDHLGRTVTNAGNGRPVTRDLVVIGQTPTPTHRNRRGENHGDTKAADVRGPRQALCA